MISISWLNGDLSLTKRANLLLAKPIFNAFIVKLMPAGSQLRYRLSLLHTADANSALILLRILKDV
jgi:hypothetical protein